MEVPCPITTVLVPPVVTVIMDTVIMDPVTTVVGVEQRLQPIPLGTLMILTYLVHALVAVVVLFS